MKLVRIRSWLGTLLLSLAFIVGSRGDTGVIRLRETQGPWRVTLYTSPDPTPTRATELAVLVQDFATGDLVLNAEVDFSLAPPAGAPDTILDVVCGMTGARLPWKLSDGLKQTAPLRAVRGQSVNRLLYTTSVVLPEVGLWKLRTTIRRGTDRVEVETELKLGLTGNRLSSIGWALATPPLAISLFACHHWIRRRVRQDHPC